MYLYLLRQPFIDVSSLETLARSFAVTTRCLSAVTAATSIVPLGFVIALKQFDDLLSGKCRIIVPCTDGVNDCLTSQSITRSAEATAVLDALRENKWPKLEELSMPACVPEGFNSNLGTTLQRGAGSNLRCIEVSYDSLESMHDFARVLCEGACPKLQSVYLGQITEDASSVHHIDELTTSLNGRGIKLRHFRDFW